PPPASPTIPLNPSPPVAAARLPPHAPAASRQRPRRAYTAPPPLAPDPSAGSHHSRWALHPPHPYHAPPPAAAIQTPANTPQICARAHTPPHRAAEKDTTEKGQILPRQIHSTDQESNSSSHDAPMCLSGC